MRTIPKLTVRVRSRHPLRSRITLRSKAIGAISGLGEALFLLPGQSRVLLADWLQDTRAAVLVLVRSERRHVTRQLADDRMANCRTV